MPCAGRSGDLPSGDAKLRWIDQWVAADVSYINDMRLVHSDEKFVGTDGDGVRFTEGTDEVVCARPFFDQHAVVRP